MNTGGSVVGWRLVAQGRVSAVVVVVVLPDLGVSVRKVLLECGVSRCKHGHSRKQDAWLFFLMCVCVR